MRIRWLSLILLLSFAVASCAPSEAEPLPLNSQKTPSEQPSPTSNENPIQSVSNTPESTEMPSNPPPVEKFVSLAKKDLAERLKVAIDDINLVKTAEMNWPDAALGCPSPGKVYTQGRVPGYQIRLDVGGVEYVYNTDLAGKIILCPQYDPDNPNSISPATSGPTQPIGPPIK